MPLESYHVFTIICDIPGCKEKKTSGNVENLRQEGWCNVEIFDNKFEICPEHQIDLREFFFATSESKD